MVHGALRLALATAESIAELRSDRKTNTAGRRRTRSRATRPTKPPCRQRCSQERRMVAVQQLRSFDARADYTFRTSASAPRRSGSGCPVEAHRIRRRSGETAVSCPAAGRRGPGPFPRSGVAADRPGRQDQPAARSDAVGLETILQECRSDRRAGSILAERVGPSSFRPRNLETVREQPLRK